MWSALDERQLVGRLYRKLQKGWVVSYNLVVRDSPDVFLNNLSFSKAVMHEAFLNATPTFRECFYVLFVNAVSQKLYTGAAVEALQDFDREHEDEQEAVDFEAKCEALAAEGALVGQKKRGKRAASAAKTTKPASAAKTTKPSRSKKGKGKATEEDDPADDPASRATDPNPARQYLDPEVIQLAATMLDISLSEAMSPSGVVKVKAWVLEQVKGTLAMTRTSSTATGPSQPSSTAAGPSQASSSTTSSSQLPSILPPHSPSSSPPGPLPPSSHTAGTSPSALAAPAIKPTGITAPSSSQSPPAPERRRLITYGRSQPTCPQPPLPTPSEDAAALQLSQLRIQPKAPAQLPPPRASAPPDSPPPFTFSGSPPPFTFSGSPPPFTFGGSPGEEDDGGYDYDMDGDGSVVEDEVIPPDPKPTPAAAAPQTRARKAQDGDSGSNAVSGSTKKRSNDGGERPKATRSQDPESNGESDSPPPPQKRARRLQDRESSTKSEAAAPKKRARNPQDGEPDPDTPSSATKKQRKDGGEHKDGGERPPRTGQPKAGSSSRRLPTRTQVSQLGERSTQTQNPDLPVAPRLSLLPPARNTKAPPSSAGRAK